MFLLHVSVCCATITNVFPQILTLLNNQLPFLFFFYYSVTYFPAENLTEYKWPPDDSGEYYMLQEQVSEYLGVTSFKRKYPGKKAKSSHLYPKDKILLYKDNLIYIW